MSNTILSLDEKIKLLIQVGESHFREFKSAYDGPPGNKKPRLLKDVCLDVARTLVAFANADGGELLIGVEDDGDITGVPFLKDEITTIINSSKTHIHPDTPLPACKHRTISIDNKNVIYISISPGSDYCYLTSDGRCLQRKDLESIPVSSEHIKATRSEITSREYDRSFVHNATLKDINLEFVKKVAEQISHGMSVEKCLQHLELAEFYQDNLKLKRAALLLFANDINRWHPRIQVRLVKVNGTEMKTGEEYNVVYDNEERGNLLDLLNSSWEMIRPHLTETRMLKDARFQTQIIYPELACREALINAIAHRDYSEEGRGIEIFVYDNRMDIINPGGLLSSISVDDLRKRTGAHQSRNALIARTLREIGYMRELGEGIRRIFNLMSENDLADPDIYSDKNAFRITLHQKYIYTKEEKLWLDNFKDFDLSRNQKTVIRLGSRDRLISTQEIWDACGIVDTEDYRLLVQSLYDLKILKKELNDNEIVRVSRAKKVPRKQIPKFKVVLPVQPVHQQSAETAAYAKIFAANIPYDLTQEQIMETFEKYGPIENISIPLNASTGLHRGYAFIEFTNTSSAAAAIQDSSKIIIAGRKLFINWAHLR